MSTEKQEYSLEHQAAAISGFARSHGYTIVQTYSDAARSGLSLRLRQGLRQLLSDVSSGQRAYHAVLVYDVSRWGRFQDTDESAHYEFLCKSAGVPVLYCAESFHNDGSLASTLMKALKRSMAGEFSRELGIRVSAGKKAIAAAGFNVGGRAPFGYRRQIVSEDPNRCRTLEAGEWKNVRSEHITLVPGPPPEVSCIRTIFRYVLDHGLTCREIAHALNAKGLTLHERRWTQELVCRVLTNPIYAGFNTWGRSSRRLGGPLIQMSPHSWVLKPDSFPALIRRSDFERAQNLMRLENGRVFWTHERILNAAKRLLKEHGRLSYKLFDQTSGVPHSSGLRKLGFERLCEQAGYRLPRRFRTASVSLERAAQLHRSAVNEFAARFPSELSILAERWPRLMLDVKILVSVVLCRTVLHLRTCRRWRVNPRLRDIGLVTILCLLDLDNTAIEKIFVVPAINLLRMRQIGLEDPLLKIGFLVEDPQGLCCLLRMVAQNRTDIGSARTA